MKKFRKKKLNKYLFLILLIGISVGFALMSTTLKINGTAGVKGNTWDIHWDDTTIQRVSGSVVPKTEAHVIDQKKQIISFEAELEVPGDFYEFTVNAINEGTVNGIIDDIRIKFQDASDQDIELPDYLKFEFKHINGSEVREGQVLEAGKSDGYRFRIEFDKDLEELPDNIIPEIKPTIEVDYIQTKEDDQRPYVITFQTTGGTATPAMKEVERGETIGEMPTPVYEDTKRIFDGWYENSPTGMKITSSYIPTSDMILVDHSIDSYATFAPGQTVNAAFKGLAGDDVTGSNPYTVRNTNITSVVRSNNPPASGTATEIVSKPGSEDIIAWFENGTIKIYSAADVLFLNEDASYMFYNLANTTMIYTDYRTNNTTSMVGLFSGTNVSSLNVSSFNTSKVTDMSSMFSGTSLTSLDVSNFDTSSVTNMATMFAGTNTLNTLDLSGFDVSNVTTFSSMFGGAGVRDLDISGWNFASATSLSALFAGNSRMQSINLEGVDTSNITDMSAMFSSCSGLTELDLSDFDTHNVTNMNNMLSYMSSLITLNMSNFDFSSYGPTSLMMNITNGGISTLKTFILNNVIFPANSTFALGGFASVETMSLRNVDTTNVTNMTNMFSSNSGLTELDLGAFDTSNVTNMTAMFNGCTSLVTIKVSDDFVVDQVTSSGGMFYNDTSLVGGQGTTYDPDHIDKEYAHYDGGQSNPGYFQKAVVVNYTVTFNANGGSVSEQTREVEGGDEIGDLPIPTKANSSYTGWYTSRGDKVTAKTVITEDITLYAEWVDDKEVVYHANNGSFNNSSTNTVTYKYNSNTDKYATNNYSIPTRSGYKFLGWSTESTSTEVTYDKESEIIENVEYFAASTDLYAVWQTEYTINFNANGGTVDPTTIVIPEGENLKLLPDPEKNDDPFIGWYTLPGGGVKVNTSTVPESNATYYAHWGDTTTETYATFDTGENVNVKFKTLAGDTLNTSDPKNTDDINIYSVERSTTAPPNGATTENVEATGSIPIVAWYENNTIKYYTTANYILLNADASYMYNRLTKVRTIDTSYITSKTTNMAHLFHYCEELQNLDLSSFNTSKVTDMSYMFNHASSLTTLDLSNFDTNKVTDMLWMFDSTESLVELDISNWNFLTYNPSRGLALDVFNIGCRNVRRLVMDNVIFPENMYYAFQSFGKVEEISLKNVDTSHVTNMNRAFYGLGNNGIADISLDLTSFDTSNVTDMQYMFQALNNIVEIDLSSFDTSNVTTMEGMFSDCTKLRSLDLSNFDTSGLVYERQTYGAMRMIIWGTTSLTDLNLSNLDFSFHTGDYSLMGYLDGNSGSHTTERLIMDNAILPQDMTGGFRDMDHLQYVSFRNTNTRNVTSMMTMFDNCEQLEYLDLSSFDTRNVTTTSSMFNNMTSLRTIVVGDKFILNKVTTNNSTHMFDDCTNLVGGAGTVYDANHIDKEYAHYDFGQASPGYFNASDADLYKIKFNPNGGTVTPKTIRVVEGSNMGVLPTPKRSRYSFVGWYTLPEGGIKVTNSYVPNSNMTLYARWVKNGWYFENEDDFGPDGEPLKEQKWQYYDNGKLIENGIKYLIARYDGTGQTRHYYRFVNGYMYIGWYTDSTTGNRYFFSWFDRDHNGYVEGHRLAGIDDIEIDGVHYSFDEDGVATQLP